MPVEIYPTERRQVGDDGEVAEWTEWRWRLKADNGEIVAQGEAHTSEGDAKRAFEGAAKLAATTLLQKQEGEQDS